MVFIPKEEDDLLKLMFHNDIKNSKPSDELMLKNDIDIEPSCEPSLGHLRVGADGKLLMVKISETELTVLPLDSTMKVSNMSVGKFKFEGAGEDIMDYCASKVINKSGDIFRIAVVTDTQLSILEIDSDSKKWPANGLLSAAKNLNSLKKGRSNYIRFLYEGKRLLMGSCFSDKDNKCMAVEFQMYDIDQKGNNIKPLGKPLEHRYNSELFYTDTDSFKLFIVSVDGCSKIAEALIFATGPQVRHYQEVHFSASNELKLVDREIADTNGKDKSFDLE